jgi:MFS family permease
MPFSIFLSYHIQVLRCAQVSFYTFVAPLGSSSMAPALPEIAAKYGILNFPDIARMSTDEHFWLGITNPTIVAMTLCVFLISFALGPLLLAPISEMYGRNWVSQIFFTFSTDVNIHLHRSFT